MSVVTLSEAAKVLGFKSRSTLYRLRDAGDLEQYLRPASSPGGAQLLELAPRGLPLLREHVARLIRPQVNNPERHRHPRLDRRWGVVAGALSEALAGCGGLALCDTEAEAIAAALPQALAEAFGLEGLERLRVVVSDLGCWRAGPGTPEYPEADCEWWSEWGRWEPGEELEDGPFWANVGPIVGGMLGPPFEGLTGRRAEELHHQLLEAIDKVERGARWDAARWDAAFTRCLLDEDQPDSAPELEKLAARGLLPPELQAEVDTALERYRERDQQAAAPLPVVVNP